MALTAKEQLEYQIAELQAQLAEILDLEDCTGAGHCHGPLKWCNYCGSVKNTCDDPNCDIHNGTMPTTEDITK